MAYTKNKLKTALDIIGKIRNWPDGLELRLSPKRKRLRLLEFRDGLNVVLRAGTGDWSVVHELLFAGGYEKALAWLAARKEEVPLVLDLGGNIGLFSLQAARNQPRARIISFEPGPPNFALFRMNMLANPTLAPQIELKEKAVSGTSGEAMWNFDEDNPGGSSLLQGNGESGKSKPQRVGIMAFQECMELFPGDIALVKMDIEGGEWDVLEKTPDEAWKRVQALAVEIHPDPLDEKKSLDYFMAGMKRLGFTVETESVCSFFLYR